MATVETLENKRLAKRAMLFEMIKKLAIKIPTEPVKCPENSFGYGKVEYKVTKCLACKICEQNCPLDAIKVVPVFNLPSIILESL